MLCILCVAPSLEVIHIFQDEGSALNINAIISKHFWLQPKVDDENSKVICTTCWSTLDAFHKFYLQVEQAHVTLQKSKTIDDEELKVENEIPQKPNNNCDEEAFNDVAPELLNADIKLEVQEDAEVALPPDTADSEKKAEPEKDLLAKRKHSTDSKVENEAPPASSTRSRTTAEKSYTESNSSSDGDNDGGNDDTAAHMPDSSPEWDDMDTENEDDDSDYKDSSSKAKSKSKKEPLKATKRRRRAKNAESGESSHKKKRSSSGDSTKKMNRIREYDEIIAKNMKLSCAVCLIVFANFAVLKKHYRVAHNECGYAACCGKKFRKRGVLVDHIYTHQNPEYFKCQVCGKVLANRKCLDCHMLTHDAAKQRIYQCDQCTLSFYTRPLLTRHLQTHISERNIKCPDCDKFFSTQDILRTHINNVHNAAYNRICDQCGKLFRRPDAFRRHQLEHDGITQPLVPCEKCGVKLTSKYGLKRHMESMHPETAVTHVCNTCGKIAPSAAALQRHISYMHKMERKYKCPMCDKAFKKTGGLKETHPTHDAEIDDYLVYVPKGSCTIDELIRHELSPSPGVFFAQTGDEIRFKEVAEEHVFEYVQNVQLKRKPDQSKGTKRHAARPPTPPVQCPEVMEGEHDVVAPEMLQPSKNRSRKCEIQGAAAATTSSGKSRRHSLDSKILDIKKAQTTAQIMTRQIHRSKADSSKKHQQIFEMMPQKVQDNVQQKLSQKLPRMKKTKRTMALNIPKEVLDQIPPHLHNQIPEKLKQRIMEKLPRHTQTEEGLRKNQNPRHKAQQTSSVAPQPRAPPSLESLPIEVLGEISKLISDQITGQVLQQQIQPALQIPSDLFNKFPAQISRSMLFEILNHVVVQTPQFILHQMPREMLQPAPPAPLPPQRSGPTLQMTLQEVAEKILQQILQAIPEQTAQHIPNLLLQEMTMEAPQTMAAEESGAGNVAYSISQHVMNEIAQQIPRYVACAPPGQTVQPVATSRMPQHVTEPRGLHNIPEYTMQLHPAPVIAPHPVPRARVLPQPCEEPDTTEVLLTMTCGPPVPDAAAQVQSEPIPPPVPVPEQTLQQKLQQMRRRVQ